MPLEVSVYASLTCSSRDESFLIVLRLEILDQKSVLR